MAIDQLNNVVTLLSNASATGSYFVWLGGKGTLTVEGTINGATLAVQFLSLNGTDIPARDVWGSLLSFTAAGQQHFELPPGQIKMKVTGGTPSALFVYACGGVQ